MAQTKLDIRLATLDDVKGITDVHCSDIDKWFKIEQGKKVAVPYDRLSIWERYEHGGPWMSIETCAIHLNYLLLAGQYPIVAEMEGRIIGELELYAGQEKGVLGKTAFMDILEVHKNFRRRGVGRKLVDFANKIAEEMNCETLSVWPDENAIPFYKKCGIDKKAFDIVHIVIELGRIRMTERTSNIKEISIRYERLTDLNFITPRHFSGYVVWLKSHWKYAGIPSKTYETGYINELNAAYIIESRWKSKTDARLILWLDTISMFPQVLTELCNMAKSLSFRKLHLSIAENLYELVKNMPHKIVGKEIMLYRDLKR